MIIDVKVFSIEAQGQVSYYQCEQQVVQLLVLLRQGNSILQVLQYYCLDHFAPTLQDLFRICTQAHMFLNKHPENVIAVHCMRGKGRTGTVIICLMLFLGQIKSVEEGVKVYSKKRFFKQNRGVTRSTQLRYLYYFHRVLTQKISPHPRFLKQVRLQNNEQSKYQITGLSIKKFNPLQSIMNLQRCLLTADILLTIHINHKQNRIMLNMDLEGKEIRLKIDQFVMEQPIKGSDLQIVVQFQKEQCLSEQQKKKLLLSYNKQSILLQNIQQAINSKDI